MTHMHLHHRPVDIDFDGGDMVGMCACVCVFKQRESENLSSIC